MGLGASAKKLPDILGRTSNLSLQFEDSLLPTPAAYAEDVAKDSQ